MCALRVVSLCVLIGVIVGPDSGVTVCPDSDVTVCPDSGVTVCPDWCQCMP